MFKRCNSLFILFVAFSSFGAKSQEAEYLKLSNQLASQQCKHKDEYNRLYKDYQLFEFYVPIYNDEIIKPALKESKSYIKKQRAWIQQEINKLSALKKKPVTVYFELNELRALVTKAQSLRIQNELFGKKYQLPLKKIQSLLRSIFKKRSFLTNLDFPIDHEQNRITYEELKKKDELKSKTFFSLRKLKESGALRGKRNDKQTRGIFNNTLSRVNKIILGKDSIDHDLFIDLKYLIKKLEAYDTRKDLVAMANTEIRALVKWRKSLKSQEAFYSALINSEDEDLKELAKKKGATALRLQEFTSQRQKEVYEFWADKEELKKLFVLETILLHEVGGLDPNRVERKEILGVVANRLSDPFYSKLSDHQMLNIKLGDFPRDRWLDTLFKQAEFSFTLWYLKASSHIFCPNQSAGVLKLRKENLRLADAFLPKIPLKQQNPIFRYFSRTSMFARINMSKAWSDYIHVVPELKLSKNSYREVALVNAKKAKVTEVRKMGEKTYGVVSFKTGKRLVFFQNGEAKKSYIFRDDQLFRYFAYRG